MSEPIEVVRDLPEYGPHQSGRQRLLLRVKGRYYVLHTQRVEEFPDLTYSQVFNAVYPSDFWYRDYVTDYRPVLELPGMNQETALAKLRARVTAKEGMPV